MSRAVPSHYYCALTRAPFGVEHPDLQRLHAPEHATSLSALQRGQRTSAAEELSPQAGHGVVLGI